MYLPQAFAVTDQKVIFDFIEKHAFGQLISLLHGRLFSTHMPFLVSDDKTSLLGHIAKQNPQHTELDGQEVLVTLQGDHHYISPSWYENPGVPTWNYQAVHITGKCKVITDAERLHLVLDTLTRKYESAFPQPWTPTYDPSMLNGIVGFDIVIADIQCKFKLNQNRSYQDQQNVAEQLDIYGATDLAATMRGKN
jgi:transcriptional regulator